MTMNKVTTDKQYSNKVLEMTKFWTPPESVCGSFKKGLNSSLRLACVVGERLYHGLRFEGEVMILTPANWRHVLTYGKPDFLLMESIWNTVTGDWHIGQTPGSPGRDTLLDIVDLARKLSIPTVFWNTKGREYHEHFKDFSRHFDAVFCADPAEAEALQNINIKAKILLPCVQPALYNPFRYYNQNNIFNFNIIYDGFVDLDRFKDELGILTHIKPYGLNIIESRSQVFRNRMDSLYGFEDCILGSVTRLGRIHALRYAKTYITFDKTVSTKISQQWMTLEATASRLAVLHNGELLNDDIRKSIAVECSRGDDFLNEVVRFQQDDLYRERIAHLGWRRTLQAHTFSHRIQDICKTIEIEHDWEEFPEATLVSPTFRKEMLSNCVENFKKQTYPNKELLIIFNGDDTSVIPEFINTQDGRGIRIFNIPRDKFTGACMNFGEQMAHGRYVFKVDDDDLYGENYVSDMILHNKSVDCDIMCKPNSCYYKYQGDGHIYSKINKINNSINVLTAHDIHSKHLIAGNSISLFSKRARNIEFDSYCLGAADTDFLYNAVASGLVVVTVDRFNMIVNRYCDANFHTWKFDKNTSGMKQIADCDENLIF